MEARILRLFDHGNYIHSLIIKALEGQGVLLGEEVNIPPSDFVHGRQMPFCLLITKNIF